MKLRCRRALRETAASSKRKRGGRLSRSTLLVLLFILLGLVVQPAAGEVSNWKVSPEYPEVGDTLKISGKAEPGEEVDILVSFEKTVPVYLREYSYELYNIEVLDFNNHITFRAEGVEDLNVGMKMLLWKANSSFASEGIATTFLSGIPPGNYRIKIGGYAERGAPSVKLKISVLEKVMTDSGGAFGYTYRTESLPEGDYEVKIGSSAKMITLSSEGSGLSRGPEPSQQGTMAIRPEERPKSETAGEPGTSMQANMWEGNVPAEEKTRDTKKSEFMSNIPYLLAGVLAGLLCLVVIPMKKVK